MKGFAVAQGAPVVFVTGGPEAFPLFCSAALQGGRFCCRSSRDAGLILRLRSRQEPGATPRIARRKARKADGASDRVAGQVVGLISDTHGLLRPEALAALAGVDLIIHAGDVGEAGILERLREIAPVVAVRGNVDTEPWTEALPTTAVAEAGSTLIYVLHNLQELDLNPAAAGFQIVVSGHTHKPLQFERDGVLYINPGSAGPRRFSLPISLAQIDLRVTPWKVEFLDLARA